MLQELEVRKGVVHAVLYQALGKVMAVLSILSEMALRLLSKASPTCWEKVACSRVPACSCAGSLNLPDPRLIHVEL